MDFYYAPTACSQATHILLREAGLPFVGHRVDIFNRALEDGSDYSAVNPNGYVPALILDDGTLLTENVAVLDWTALQHPALMPTGPSARTRHLQLLAFISTEMQKPFVRLFFSEDEGEQAYLRQTLPQRFAWIAGQLQGDYLFGERFTPADAFLYVMRRWAAQTGIDVPANLEAWTARVESRDAVKAALREEGVEPLLLRA